MDLQETRLPGIGVRHDFVTAAGQHLGVVTHRAGGHELVLYDTEDPDACRVRVVLADDEADLLAELLGAPRVIERIARLHEQVEGLVTEGIVVHPGSPFDGRTVADSMMRSRTGASIVAVIRQGEMILSPAADFAFEAGDTAVIVGTREGVDAAARLVAGG
ncbi:MAG TPA: cation:proton antiporter regulatory subunit [Acidimicrobiales bacterium]|nr:cation:proton antiporter regulatory subunit [Acidimicrobiales bacterium]